MDSNRDGQINKYELFNLFRYLTQPGYNPLPYSYGNYSYGNCGVGGGNVGYSGVGIAQGGSYGGVPTGYTETYSSTTTTTTYPATTATTYTNYETGLGGAGSWTNSWGGW
jgi:hypothetical protein